ncbi:MAG: urease accessory protein [Candidatus Tokpelaia sp. JSC188]|nr:MAG: urease accessory protein [Candidatus Tokpelaia sp. JSC188]
MSTSQSGLEKKGYTYQLIRLMTLLSPVFPIGAFSYSHGLEQAVHDGLIRSSCDMEDWLRGILKKGSAWNDVIFLTEAWRYEKRGADITPLIQLARAISGSYERELEIFLQGEAFLKAVADYNIINTIGNKKAAYSVSVGVVAARIGLEMVAVATAYLQAFVANLIQAALRLVPLGQKDGVRLMHKLEEDILSLSQRTPQLTLDDLGSSTVMLDICSMRHEKLYSRVFRS